MLPGSDGLRRQSPRSGVRHANVEDPCQHSTNQGSQGGASRPQSWVAAPCRELFGGAVLEHTGMDDVDGRSRSCCGCAVASSSRSRCLHVPADVAADWISMATIAQRVRGLGCWEGEGSFLSVRRPRCAERPEGVSLGSSTDWMVAEWR